MVGYGKKYPRRPHHRAASCPKDMSKVCDYSFALEKDDNPTAWDFDELKFHLGFKVIMVDKQRLVLQLKIPTDSALGCSCRRPRSPRRIQR